MSEIVSNKNKTNIDLPAEMASRLNTAANVIKASSAPFRVISHYDADGLTAGTVLSALLIRLNKTFHLSLVHNLDPKARILKELKDESDSVKIFADMGSSSLDKIEGFSGWSIILDHHSPLRDSEANSVIHINPHLYGINGSTEVSGATLSFLLAVQISNRNWDLLPIAIAGAMGDKQHKNGFKGLNLKLIDAALSRNIIKEKTELKLTGDTIEQALVRATDPYFIGLSNNEAGVLELLNKLQIDPKADPHKLDKSTAQSLASYLVLLLIDQNIPPEDAEEFITKRYISDKYTIELEEFSHIINSCGRMREMGVGVAAGLGDKTAFEHARKLRVEYKEKILKGLKKLEDKRPKELDNIQYFYEPTAEFAGTFAGIGMMYFFNQAKPVVALSKSEKNIKISGRGTIRLVNSGLDLAKIFNVVATELKGTGGGHQIAAGATIPKNSDKEFLEKVNILVGEQLPGSTG